MGKSRDFERVGFFGDLHCGHWSGLTHRDYLNYPTETAPQMRRYISRYQEACNKWFNDAIKHYKPFDKAVWTGDSVEGTGFRKGGNEVLLDLDEQVDCAARIVKSINAPTNKFVYGTNYHVTDSDGLDMEAKIAKEVGAERPQDFAFLRVQKKLTFHVKHHIGASQREQAKFTALAASMVGILLEIEKGKYPKTDIIIRGHRHQHTYCGRKNWLAMVTPGLQGATSFGGRRCDGGEPDYGFLVFDVYKDGSYTWEAVIADLPEQKYRVEDI